MKNLIPLSATTRHSVLVQLITAYNQFDAEASEIEQIFLLQKINHYIETCVPDLELTAWRTALGQESLEANLQRYGISRDGSTLVKNIQFAAAITQYAPSVANSDMDYFSALQARNALLVNTTDSLNEEETTKYIQCNKVIMHKFDNDLSLQDQYTRSQYFLSLCYAKMEAIRGAVDQEFETFQTSQLGERTGNNRNFTLNVEGEDKQLVLRVEDRNSLVNEQVLQTYAVSEYFSEEYYVMMLPFKEGYLETYRPVVLSEYVEKGSLDNYAESLLESSSEDVRRETQNIFLQLSDFCIKLMESGHYHPDIKLSNFLTDGKTIKVSDRKTITDKKNPTGSEISSTPIFSPPEYRACFNKTMTAANPTKASRIILDMPSLMSYQMGMALKEFVMSSIGIEGMTPEMFLGWMPITAILSEPRRTQKNLFALVQELTRTEPQDRLSIVHFQDLLKKIHLPHSKFLTEIETLSPQENLSKAQELEIMRQLIQAPQQFTPKLRQQWSALKQKDVATELYSDPRLKFFEHAAIEIKYYLQKIDRIIAAENRKKAGSMRLVGSFLGVPIPEVTKIEELPALPVMPEKIKWYFEILEEMPTPMLEASDIEKLRHIQMRQDGLLNLQVITPSSNNSSLTTSPDESPNYSPIGNLIADHEFTDTDDPFDSGTFKRVARLLPNVQPSDSDSVLDSGSVLRVPINEQIPEDDKSADLDTELDTGTVVIRKQPVPSQKQSYMKHIIKGMHEQAPPVDQQSSPKASDIDTTIKRGNKGK